MNLAVTYAVLAAIAMAMNLSAQKATTWLYSGPYALTLALTVGTGVGLVVKYLLDKRYIFLFKPRDLAHDGRIFLLYAFMSIFTTLIFWGAEYLSDYLFESESLRYLGGAIGLAIGYFTKYHLDKRFVFPRKQGQH
jgi:putative flippase GtrA